MSDNKPEENEVTSSQDPRSKGMIIAGVAASEVTDSSGERISIEGTDISDLEAGVATLNVEHAVQGENGAFGEETVGVITFAKKIFKESDCDNDVERKFWSQIKAPFIFILGRLYDAAGHKSAQAIAAQIRDHHANGEKINCRFSIEGLTLDRDDDGNLTHTIAKKVSITLKPCNKTCDTTLVADPQAPDGFDKQPVKEKLGKSLPGAIGFIGGWSGDVDISDIAPLEKALTAGYADAAPSSLTGGSVFSPENISGKKRKKVIDLVTSYKPGDDQGFSQSLKSILPEISDDFINHFKEIGEKIHAKNIRKLTKAQKVAAGHELLLKLENAAIELSAELGSAEQTVPFAGHDIVPGKLTTSSQLYDILFADQSYYYIVPEGKAFDYELGDLSKLPKIKEGEYYRVLKHPHLPLAPALPLAKAIDLDQDRIAQPQEGLGWAKGGGKPPQTSTPSLPNPNAAVAGAGGGGKKRLTLHPNGDLETPTGQRLSLHIPSSQEYMEILKPHSFNIPEEKKALYQRTVHEPWERAMNNWMALNKRAREGQLPRSVIKLAGLFSAMSPNTGVSLQERHFGHLMDMMHEGEMNISQPINQGHIDEFARRAQGPLMPSWNNDFYVNAKDSETGAPRFPQPGVATWDEANARAAEPNKFGNQKADLPQVAGLRSLDDIMPHLEHMFATYKGDGRKMAEELMNMKSAYKRAATATSAGEAKEKFAGQHPIVEGFGPKLARYMLGMAGAGNIIVPDRHMTRSFYNLGKDDPMSEYLATRVVTQPKNEPFLRSLDEHFYNKHPTVQHVLQKYPEHFKGAEDQAIFPAFWLHWLHLPHYERNQGRPTDATIGGTDHQVYWDAVQDSMRKHGIPISGPQYHYNQPDTSFNFGENLKSEGSSTTPIEVRAAAAIHDLTKRVGETGASLAYYTYIVPHLLAKSEVVNRPFDLGPLTKAEPESRFDKEYRQKVLLADKNLSPDKLMELFRDPASRSVKAEAVAHDNFPQEGLDELIEHGDPDSVNDEMSFRELRSKKLTFSQWKKLDDKHPADGVAYLAMNKDFLKDKDVQAEVVDKASRRGHHLAAQYFNLVDPDQVTTSQADKLYDARIGKQEPGRSVSKFAKIATKISGDKLEERLKSPISDVLYPFTQNPNFTKHHHDLMTKIDSDEARSALMASPHTDDEYLEKAFNGNFGWDKAIRSGKMSPQLIKKLLSDPDVTKDPNRPQKLVELTREYDLKPDAADAAIRNPIIPGHAKAEVLKNPDLSPETLRYAARQATSTDARPGHGYNPAFAHQNLPEDAIEEALSSGGRVPFDQIVKNPNLSPNSIHKLMEAYTNNSSLRYDEPNYEALEHLFGVHHEVHPNLKPEHIQEAIEHHPHLRSMAIQSPVATKENLTHAWNTLSHPDYLEQIVKNPNVSDEIIKEAANLPDSHEGWRAKRFAQGRLSELDPDSTHQEHVQTSLGTGKLRKIRDLMEEKGVKEIHPSKLPPGDFSRIREPNGNISLRSIQAAIDATPKQRWNVSHDTWEGAQRHDDWDPDYDQDYPEGSPQHVFQMNLSTHHLNALRQAGAYSEFKKLFEASKRSGHPVTPTTVGWVRYTGDPESGYHIDEVQSDFGQSFHKQIAGQAKAHAQKEAREQGLEGDEAEKYVTQRQGQLVAEGHKYMPDDKHAIISNILFGNKPANEHIFEAFRQHLRDKGYHNTPIHINSPELKAPLSGLDPDSPIPGHFHNTYEKVPKQAGMEPAKYGDLPTQSNPGLQGKKTFADKVRKAEDLTLTEMKETE